MGLYQCPVCDCLPVRYNEKGKSKPICIRCNRQLARISEVKKGYLWAIGLASAGMTLITIPDLINHFTLDIQQARIVKSIQGSLPPVASQSRTTVNVNTEDLLSQLQEADLQWRPEEQVLADGTTRYLYKRRQGEPDLSVAELERLLQSPPTFEQERKEIAELLQALKLAGAKVVLAPTLKEGAAAEWDHQATTLRIQPRIIQKGSVDFLRVLSHEVIHVAQSCKAGSLSSKPEALGIEVNKQPDILSKLNDPVYSKASQWEQLLEKEAFAAQNYSSIARYHLERQCKAAY
ncbi:MAG: hypothetical protein VKN83_03950 [Cyanobacteriota bacterium]|nr:hypothetical protein [Cyanobacteriota bacterium]